MKDIIYTANSQRKVELSLLIVYSVYNISIMSVLSNKGWSNWIMLVVMAGLTLSWAMYAGKYKTYSFRANCAAFVMQGSVILYAIQANKMEEAIPVFMLFTVLIGLYGIARIIYMTVISVLFVFIYHVVVKESVPLETLPEIMKAMSQMANMFLLQYLAYLWTKKNSEGSKRLMQVIEDLKVSQNSKDDFVANVSHEIRTPVNTICGMSEILLEGELPDKVKDDVRGIQTAGRNLMALVGDILDFSELQSGKMELEEEAYTITSMVNDVINMTLARRNEKKIEILVDCDANIPCALYGDEKKIRRVIINLVDNAIKFTEEGFICIKIGYRKETYGINLLITIKDSGIGIEEESVTKMFDSFSQVDASRKRQEGGLGLGFTISYELVKKMGGAIVVKTRRGKGSTVSVTIPQKVLDESPVASIKDRENINVATYIDIEQFDLPVIRDEYYEIIMHMAEQLKGKCCICRDLAELQRRGEKEKFSHVFTGVVEYMAKPEYFDELAKRTKVIIVTEHSNEKHITNPNLMIVYKPFYILTIVSVLNGEYSLKNESNAIVSKRFTTKDVHVLAVDDNSMNIRVIEGLLANYNIKVSKAYSGKEALEKITTADYDFVFMDHMMPEMDGVETLKNIRNKVGTYYQKVPIIALTANAVAGTREMLLSEGFNDFLEKPVERSVLERVLKRTLPSEKIVYEEDSIVAETSKEQETVKQPVLTETTDENSVASLTPLGLDIEKGIMYCSGEEQYKNILQRYCEDYNTAYELAVKAFEERDWKNYVITVHGMKSSLHSVGAIKLSEFAKALELAGKDENIQYILEHHIELMVGYKELFAKLLKNKWLHPEGEKVQEEEALSEKELPVLSDEMFDKKIAELEDMMYALDGDGMLEIITELQEYQYGGAGMKALLAPVKRKIEMCDYASAVEKAYQIRRDNACGKI